jgi:hypothetical protein
MWCPQRDAQEWVCERWGSESCRWRAREDTAETAGQRERKLEMERWRTRTRAIRDNERAVAHSHTTKGGAQDWITKVDREYDVINIWKYKDEGPPPTAATAIFFFFFGSWIFIAPGKPGALQYNQVVQVRYGSRSFPPPCAVDGVFPGGGNRIAFRSSSSLSYMLRRAVVRVSVQLITPDCIKYKTDKEHIYSIWVAFASVSPGSGSSETLAAMAKALRVWVFLGWLLTWVFLLGRDIS